MPPFWTPEEVEQISIEDEVERLLLQFDETKRRLAESERQQAAMFAGKSRGVQSFDAKFTSDLQELARKLADRPFPDAAQNDLVRSVKLLDLMLQPEEAEIVIGDLVEEYARRAGDLDHARRWLRRQVYRIAAHEVLKWVAKVASSVRAGK